MRVHHVLGANTDVGKTVFATALAIASAALPIGRTTAPSLAPHADADKVTYLKPVSTGPDSDADSSYVAADRHIARFAPHIPSRTLVQFREPLSPHVAARRPDGSLPPHASDAAIVHGVASWIQTESARASVAYIESAGGVHSPAPSGSSQADLLRPLRLPVVLVGSSELGGISTTRAAFESLRMRGYDVEAVLMFPSHIYENDIYLRQWLAEEHGVPVFTLGGSNGGTVPGAPPPRAATDAGDAAAMHAYYDALIRGNEEQQLSSVFQVVAHLRESHTKRYSDLASLAGRARNSFWWPFTQHERVTRDSDVLVIDSAYADHFEALNSSGALAPVLDGSSSWWTQALGHGSPRIAQAAAYAAGRYGHVIFPGAAHAPAVELAETMLNGHIAPGRGWASRVFFSDDGSTATEIALKMAIQSAARRYAPERAESDLAQAKLSRRGPGGISGRPEREFEVLGLDGSYHGDTIGAMDACSPNVFNKEVAWYRGRGCWLSAPTVSIRDGVAQVAADEVHTFDSLAEVLDVDRRLQTDLALHYRMSIRRTLEHLVVVERRRFGALVLEPVVMGAGGMIFVDPLYQHCLVDVVRESEDLFALTDAPLRSARAPVPPSSETTWRGLPVVYDDATAAEIIGAQPDIACYAKILSGGLVPLALTLASPSIFETFAHPEKTRALLHGHSYTAHPVGCAVALEALSQIDSLHASGAWADAQADWQSTRGWSMWSRARVLELSRREHVSGAWALGTVLTIELGGNAGYQSTIAESLVTALRAHGMHVRPLGNVVYIMCSLNTSASVLRRTEDIVSTLLDCT